MDPWEVAQAQVATKYDPQQNALQRQLDQAYANTTTNEQAIQGYGNTGRQIIGETYNKLYDWLNYGKADQQQQLGQSVANTNAAYDRAISDIQGYQQQSRSYLNDMARALGQEGAGYRANTELEGLVNTQLGRASSGRANYGTSLADWAAKMGTIADMGISSAHQGEAQGRTEFETMLLEMLGQNKLAGTTQETDLMNKLSDIMGLRQSDLISMYNELAQAEWERQFKQAQLDQEASIAQAQIDAAAAEGAANRAASAKDDSLAWAEFNEGIRRWNAENQQGLDAAGLTQSNWERDFGLRSKEAPIDRSADAELFWDDDRFMDPKTKQNDIGAYLRFKATGELPNWNTNKGGGGVSGVIHSNGLREFLGGAAQMGLSPAHTMYGWLK